MRLIQHKREAYWFYRFLSLVYDRVNPLFWTPAMRDEALLLARLDDPVLDVLDVGAGTGFTTSGIVASVAPERVRMLDQSPHQLAVAARKPELAAVERIVGDAEALPFDDDSFDRYVSAGSIEYWPDPQRAIDEAYRVTRAGGRALVVGPLPPANRAVRWVADLWMLFPAEADYLAWFERAGFADVERVHVAPEWHEGGRGAYAIAIAGRKPAPGPPARDPSQRAVDPDEPDGALARLRFAARLAVGSVAGALFIPIALALTLVRRLRGRP